MSDDSETLLSDGEQFFLNKLDELFQECEEKAFQRHEAGAVKYGSFKFLGVDTLQEALEEVLDLINYGRYTYVKLRLLQEAIAEEAAPLVTDEPQGGGFIPTSDMFKGSGK
jgi:hypothetical protein